MEVSRLMQDETAETVSRDQNLRHIFPCSAGHEHDWQPYPVDPYSYCMCDHTYASYPTTRGHLIKNLQKKKTQREKLFVGMPVEMVAVNSLF